MGRSAQRVATELKSDKLLEVGNMVLNSCLSTFANLLEQEVSTSVPEYAHGKPKQLLNTALAEKQVLFICINFQHDETVVQDYISLLFDAASMEKISEALNHYLKNMGLI